MKIKRIKLTNNPILGELEIDFTDQNDNPVDTIILAGENGTGKTTILDIIYEFSNYKINRRLEHEKREFELVLSEQDLDVIKENDQAGNQIQNISSPLIKITFDYSFDNWNQIKVNAEINGEIKEIGGNYLSNNDVKKIFRSIYSDVEINFTPGQIKNVTAKKLDEEKGSSVRTSNNIATEIAQLLVDVKTLDDADFTDWAKNNVGKKVDESKLEPRIKRFKKAFSFMFPELEIKKVENVQGQKKVIFEQFGEEIFLEDLSSGEKQIVFRGGFLLKDKQSNKGIFALIDEPEISLHPDWQLKILDYYKRLFKDENGKQQSQIFLATHSPFIIHNYRRDKDKVIVLKKNDSGEKIADQNASYYDWKKGQVVQEAFRVNNFLDSSEGKPVLITEGKTDAKILRSAWKKLYPNKEKPFLIEPSGIEIEEEKRSGNADQARRTLELISNISNGRTIIGLFDNDKEGNKQFKGINKKIFEGHTPFKEQRKHKNKNIYGLLLPVPSNREKFVTDNDIAQRYLEIEHYFCNEVLESYNLKGECILGTEVFKIKGNKNDFAEAVEGMEKDKFSEFNVLFDKIVSIIN